ncbi:MAG: hypothetical protein BWY88_01159 [Synergistetes bacterium ADurb.Bin520]|nr:MAG: hypothetical protein BWY88_01159 [Synergistetes bacterium ADurb.Bin520]
MFPIGPQGRQGLGGVELRGPVPEHCIHREGRPVGHQGFREPGKDDVPLPQAQALGEDADQRGVEGQGAPFENDGGAQLQSLGQAADGLLGDGVEAGQGDVLPGHPLIQQRLDVGLGEDTAAPGNVVHMGPPGGGGFELFHRNFQQARHLVDEGPGAAGAAAVHPHVRGHQAAGCLVVVEKDDLRVLAPQLHRHPGPGMEGLHGDGVGHHLLDVEGVDQGRDGPSPAAADGGSVGFPREEAEYVLEHIVDGLGLPGVVPEVTAVEYFGGLRVEDDGLDGGGAHIETQFEGMILVFHGWWTNPIPLGRHGQSRPRTA